MTHLQELLGELTRAWQTAGQPMDVLAPGLDQAEISRPLQEWTGRVPQEIVDWFSWRNGRSARSPAAPLAPSRFDMLSLDEALRRRLDRLEGAASLAASLANEDSEMAEPDFWWERGWLPLGVDSVGTVLAVDLSAEHAAVPVLVVDWEGDSFREARASCLAELARLWLSVMRAGLCRFDERTGQFHTDFGQVPPNIRRTGLI